MPWPLDAHAAPSPRVRKRARFVTQQTLPRNPRAERVLFRAGPAGWKTFLLVTPALRWLQRQPS